MKLELKIMLSKRQKINKQKQFKYCFININEQTMLLIARAGWAYHVFR